MVVPGAGLVAGGGKEGILYLLDRENLGGVAAAPASALPPKCQGQPSGYCAPYVANDPSHDRALSEVQAGENSYLSVHGQLMNDWTRWPHIHGSPVYGDFGPGKRFFYVWPEKDYLKAISLENQRLTIAHRGPDRAPAGEKTKDGSILGGMPGGMLSLVIDSSNPAHGVLFASVPVEGFIVPQLHGALHAYDPLTLKRVWTSRESSEHSYWFAKFVSPTITPAGLLADLLKQDPRLW